MGTLALDSFANGIGQVMWGNGMRVIAAIIFCLVALGVASHSRPIGHLGITIFGIACWFGAAWWLQQGGIG